jgi:HK97 family phage portal protein
MIAPSNSVDSGKVRRGGDVWNSLVHGGDSGSISESGALGISTVFACTQVIAGAIASLPMHVYKREDDGDKIRDYRHDYWWILNEEFSPRWTAAAAWQFLVASKLLHGNAYAEIKRSRSGRVIGIVPIHPDRVRPIASPDGSRLVYEIAPDPTIEKPDTTLDINKIRTLDQDDVIHVSGLGFDGLRGLSPLQHWMNNPAVIAKEAQRFAAHFLKNNSRPDYALQTEQNLSEEQFASLQEMLREHEGARNAGRPMILEGGLEVKPLTMPLKDMQLLETRKFQVEEICRVYGVPPFMVGHTEKTTSWGSGVSEMGQGFVRFTLRDHLNAFQSELNRKIFRKSRRMAEFDTRELERANTKELFQSLRVALGRAGEQPFMTIGEVREFISLPRNADLPEPIASGSAETVPAFEQGDENTDNGDTDEKP